MLQEQPAVVLLLERALVSLSLAVDEHGRQEDLHGLGCQSIISTAELSCIAQASPA
jgi:hypothetical protein